MAYLWKQCLRYAAARKARTMSCLAGVMIMGASQNVWAQDADANNPLANVVALNFQDIYVGDTYASNDQSSNQFIVRYARPFKLGQGNWLMRASVPLNTVPTSLSGDHKTGLGDIDAFAAYTFKTKNPAVSFGVGPQVVIPTGGKKYGADQWQLGLANVYFNGTSPKFQYGYLATYRTGVGDTNGNTRTSLGAVQTFAFYQFGGGWYTGTAPTATYNFKNDSYNIPLGLRLGKTTRAQKGTVMNLFIEPQISIAHEGNNQAKWQVFAGLNLQFAN